MDNPPPVDNLPTDPPVAPALENPPTYEPAVDNPPTENPIVDPAGENPLVENPPADNPPTDPAMGTPPLDNPPAVAENPPPENSPIDNPRAGETPRPGDAFRRSLPTENFPTDSPSPWSLPYALPPRNVSPIVSLSPGDPVPAINITGYSMLRSAPPMWRRVLGFNPMFMHPFQRDTFLQEFNRLANIQKWSVDDPSLYNIHDRVITDACNILSRTVAQTNDNEELFGTRSKFEEHLRQMLAFECHIAQCDDIVHNLAYSEQHRAKARTMLKQAVVELRKRGRVIGLMTLHYVDT